MGLRMVSKFSFSWCFLVIFSAWLSPACSAQTHNSEPGSSLSVPAQKPGNAAAAAEYQEDFSSLSLKGSRFFPLPPALGQVDDYPQNSFVRERWQMMWRPSDPIDLFICKPRGLAKPPVILYLYTYPSTTDRFKSDDWCGTTTANGFAAVGFLSAYTGHRLEMRSPTATFFTDFQESLGATVHDVQLILDYLATRGDLDMGRIGMYGQGSGGTIAILASATDARIKALDVLTPWGDWPNFFAQTRFIAAEQRAKFSSPDFLAKVAPLEPLTWLPKVKATSLRIQDVRKSGPMPDASQERLEAIAPEKAIMNEYGDPAALVPHASGGGLFVWLHAQLQPDAKPQVALEKSERVHVFPAMGDSPLPPLGPQSKN
jgi:hypothetical protein